jgi:hypothetical protein
VRKNQIVTTFQDYYTPHPSPLLAYFLSAPFFHKTRFMPKFLSYLSWFLLLFLCSCYNMRKSRGGGQIANVTARTINTDDIALPPGYHIDAVATGLTFPSGATLDDENNLYVIETGYSYGEVLGEPRLLKIGKKGATTVVCKGSTNGPWTGLIFYKGYFYISEGGEMEGGKILKVSKDGIIETLVSGLPSMGDHHTDAPIIKDNYIYFGQGTVTNSAVVGIDNLHYGWLKRHKELHDIPCMDLTLAGVNYESDNIGQEGGKVSTGAYVPYGTPTSPGQVIKGSIPCSGAVLRIPIDGGHPELVAWGFRNPFGLALSPDGRIFVSENGFDDRGSRPVWGAGDVLWEVKDGRWYGWPDYSAGSPISGKEEFKSPGKDPVKSLLQTNPGPPPSPTAIFGVHSSANGMDFSSSRSFGHQGELFVAEFGDMAPEVGKVLAPVGFKVVRVNVANGVVEDFAVNKGKKNGPASKNSNGGLERPLAVRFSANGKTMYVVDFGIVKMTGKGPLPQANTGVVWKITKR